MSNFTYQLNQNTHWLDGSTVYGSNSATLATLRQYTGGLLKVSRDATNNRDLLPITSSCTTAACFYAGKCYLPMCTFVMLFSTHVCLSDYRGFKSY